MDNNFEVIKSIYENECQRILECKELKTGESYIYNIIYNLKLMKLIDVNSLTSINSNIVKCQKTEDRLYIVTKLHELSNQKLLKDYIDSKTLTLKQQFSLTEQLINLFIQIYNTTDLLQYKILSFDNLSVDEDNVLFANGYFEFKDEYDLSDNYSYKNIGHIIHYIFSKEEILDYSLSDTIAPDVMKIIVKCLTREYFHPKDTLKELENSPIYGLINCKTDSYLIDKKLSADQEKHHKDAHAEKADSSNIDNLKNKIIDNHDYDDDDLSGEFNDIPSIDDDISSDDDISLYDDISLNNDSLDIGSSETIETEEYSDMSDLSDNYEDEEDSNIIDVFLSDSAENKNDAIENSEKNEKLKSVMKYALPAIMIVFIVAVTFFIIKSLFGDTQQASGDNIDSGTNVGKVEDNKPNDKDTTDDKSSADDKSSTDNNDKTNTDSSNNNANPSPDNDDHKQFFNDDLIKKIAYTGKLASVSTEVYNTGNSSLLVENEDNETTKVLFAVIDFTNEKLSYMLNDTVVITAKFKSFKDLDAKLIVEVYKDNKVASNASAKISIQNDIWIQKDISVVTKKIDRVNLYLEFAGKNKIWIDNISVDIVK